MAITGRIGPNAIIQTAAALREQVGEGRAWALVHGATGRAFDTMPEDMVEEGEVIQLVHALDDDLDPALFEVVMRDAGRRTADYLIANRIPRVAQRVMRVLPAPLALRVLLQGIMRHTWTFAGTAHVSVVRRAGQPPALVMERCPMCRGLHANAPACHFYSATLARLLQQLVTPHAQVVERACAAMGAPRCEFELRVARVR